MKKFFKYIKGVFSINREFLRLKDEVKYHKELSDSLWDDFQRKCDECEKLKNQLSETRIKHDILFCKNINFEGEIYNLKEEIKILKGDKEDLLLELFDK